MKNVYIREKKFFKKRGSYCTVFDDFGEKFLIRFESRKYSHASLLAYRNPLRRFFRFLSDMKTESLREVDIELLEEYVRSLFKSELFPATIELYIRTLKLFFSFLAEEGYIFINPALELEQPKTEMRLQHVPSVDDMSKLLSVINATTPLGIRNRAIVEMAYSCALRTTELLELSIFSLDLDTGRESIRVIGKGDKERVLPLTAQALFWLKQYLDGPRDKLLKGELDNSSLWIASGGKTLEKKSLAVMLRKHSELAKLAKNITVHSIRRACATHMLANGAEPIQIQTMLGHADLKTLRHYLKITFCDLKTTHLKSKVGR